MKWLIFGILLTAWPLVADAQLRVVTSASIFADMIANIGGAQVEVLHLVPTGADPHTYDPIPSDIQKIKQADLVFLNGLTFEVWIEKLIRNVSSTTPIVILTAGIAPLQSEDYPDAPDPHAWLDPVLGKIYLENIYSALLEAMPQHEKVLRENFEAYTNAITELHLESLAMVELIPLHQRKLITSHDAFRYFGKRYGFDVFAAMGTSTDADIRIGDIMQLKRAIQDYNIGAVFIESTINPQLMQQIARDYNIIVGGKLYADSLSEQGKPVATYLGMLRHNIETIVAGLLSESDADSAKSTTPVGAWLGLVSFLLVAFFITWRKIDDAK